ncbi:hypothetical protein PHMEG_00034956 [Phytophthora megakarya]|uniref:Uncharacterized protein n=1 Tax=Phytophthora megakarya TaxID=4795 RepID=A0A225UQ23_9STRA|nr:hypothetical protein PHMEG_00034956 [Phytophthora megakarya]
MEVQLDRQGSLIRSSDSLLGQYFACHTHHRDPSTMIRSMELGYLAVNDANVHRYQEAQRILNTPELPVHHSLVESLEAYQVNAGLTKNSLTVPNKPPIHVTTWIAQVIRFAASMKPPLRCECDWMQPTTACSQRSNDKPLMFITPIALKTGFVAANWNPQFKLLFVGDICTESRTRLLTQDELCRKGYCNGAKRGKVGTLYDKWKAVLTAEVKVPVGIVPCQLRIGVGHWIVAAALDTSGPEPTLHRYELGHRDIGDVTRHSLGTVIPIK